MQDIFIALLIGVVGAFMLVPLARRYRAREVGLLFVAYFAHVVAGFAQVLITEALYGGGDIFGYARRGAELAAALAIDFQGMASELLLLLFQQDAVLPMTMSGIGSSTGSMSAIAAIVSYLTGGGVYTGCVLLGAAAFFSKLAIYEVFRDSYPERLHRQLLVANLLVPSVVFWSSGLLKEAVAIVGLGPVMLGLHWLLTRRILSGFVLLALGSVTIGLVKAYILFAFVVAAAAWVYAVRAWKGRRPGVRPLYLGLGLAAAVGGLALLGKVFPQYALESLADQAAYHQEIGERVRGGSTYTLLGDASEASISVQLLYAPLALVTSLYRPFIFESNNAQLVVNSLETTALLLMTLWLFWKVPLRRTWLAVVSSPLATFMLVFVVVFGIAVGLTTTNLGTLSRYRVPLVPLFASLLVVLLGADRDTQPRLPVGPLRMGLRRGTPGRPPVRTFTT